MDHSRALAHYSAQLKRPSQPQHLARWIETLPADSLRGEAIALANEVALLAGYGHTAQAGAETIRLNLGDADCLVEYEYSPGRPGCHTQRNGDPGWPDEPEELSIIGAFVNGHWIDTDDIAPSAIERWEGQIRRHIADRNEADRAELEAA